MKILNLNDIKTNWSLSLSLKKPPQASCEVKPVVIKTKLRQKS